VSVNRKTAEKQCEQLLELLREQPVTQLDAIRELGCMRLASRIYDLRRRGHIIDTHRVLMLGRFGSNRIAEYRLVREWNHGRP